MCPLTTRLDVPLQDKAYAKYHYCKPKHTAKRPAPALNKRKNLRFTFVSRTAAALLEADVVTADPEPDVEVSWAGQLLLL